ncbi:MAG: hypothetical protein HY606_12800, partial [Planctomycetes bacterium]|nr:hypothetical protein [Planctomycetota bacterium]
NKYKYLYGDSFKDFIYRNKIKYIIVDQNWWEKELFVDQIKDITRLKFQKQSSYGVGADKMVFVFEVLDEVTTTK